jgi:transposase
MLKEPMTATTTCSGKPIHAKGAKQGMPAGAALPDPEVFEKAVRRRFTTAYKLCILHAADVCAEPGQLGAL